MRTRILLLALMVPPAALAQTPPSADYVLIGAGVRSRPAYDGSDSQRVDVIPVLRYYGRPLFARTTQGLLEGGARMRLGEGVEAGAQLAYEAGRNASESSLLRARGLPDLDWGVSAGLHVEADWKAGPMPLNFLARTRHHLDFDRGHQLDLRLTAGVYARGPLQAGVFTQATWASRKYVSTFYTGGGSGWLFTSVGALASYDLRRDWMVVGSVELRRLQGDAAHSPITETRSNPYASLGLAYRF